MKRIPPIAFCLLCVISTAFCIPARVAAQPGAGTKPNYASELPRIPSKEPLAAMAEIQIKEGYKLELAAAEPLVRDPVAMSFDENGRLFVVEMCDYSEQDKEFLGNIRMLEDANNDGQYEKSTLFAHHLSWPTGIICYDGGVFVAAAPDIWYIKDTDGDGQADIQRKVFTGFGRTNVQGLLNSFCWGIDNRIYCQTSSSGGTITMPESPNQPAVAVGGRDFSFDPKTLALRLESGGGQHGMCFDDWGRRFACQNSDHLQLFLYPDRYSATSKNVPLPASRQSIAADGPQASVYRISPVEPWRLVRTRLRVTNQSPGVVEGGGRAAGYFTSATGVTIYRGDAFPEDMLGAAIVGDVGSNIIHRKKLTENGISMVGTRIDKESEFIAAKDIWFRPVQFANAPDGTLYIADLYREVIEHPRSLPEEIKQHLDLTSGRDRGRIYRVVPTGFQRPAMPKLKDASTDELIATLEKKNGWHRDTASRLLYERLVVHGKASDIAEAATKLVQMATKSNYAPARLHALGVLASCGAGQGGLIQSLSDSHPRVREWSVQLLEDSMSTDGSIQDQLLKLAADPDPRVRFQLALSLNRSSMNDARKVDIALKLLANAGQDPWLNAASLNAIGPNAVEAIGIWLSGQGRGGSAGANTLRSLASLSGKLATLEQLESLDKRIASLPEGNSEDTKTQLCIGLIQALQTRFSTAKSMEDTLGKLPTIASLRKKLIEEARPVCKDSAMSPERRVEAIQFLMWDSSDSDIEMLAGMLNQREPQSIQEAATRALMRFQTANVPEKLLSVWPTLTPKLRALAADVMLSRGPWIDLLLDGAGQGAFSLNELEPSKLANLKNNPKTRERVEKLLKSSNSGTRQEVFERYRTALTTSGDKKRGKEVFAKSCAACHRLENVGYELAPNLATFQFRGAEAILQNIIEPNREVNPQYLTYSILTNDDRIVNGMISNESAASITLLRGENVSETLQRSDIAEMKSSKVSLMPEGLENQIDIQGMADLIAYLTTLP
jgi:putative membrane-bound dehydrogenase-like protein